jgi:hypothetical protein
MFNADTIVWQPVRSSSMTQAELRHTPPLRPEPRLRDLSRRGPTRPSRSDRCSDLCLERHRPSRVETNDPDGKRTEKIRVVRQIEFDRPEDRASRLHFEGWRVSGEARASRLDAFYDHGPAASASQSNRRVGQPPGFQNSQTDGIRLDLKEKARLCGPC